MKQQFRKALCIASAALLATAAVPSAYTAYGLIERPASYVRVYKEETDMWYNRTIEQDANGHVFETDREADYLGDVDRTGEWDYMDAQTMLMYLFGENENMTEQFPRRQYKPELGDMNGDGKINAVDLTLLKRRILYPPEMDPVEAGVWPPINPNDYAYTVSTGEQRMLVLVADFADFRRKDSLTAEQIHDRLFGPEDKSSAAYPYESMSAFYSRTSYGRLGLTGDVYTYTSDKNLTDFYAEQENGTVAIDLNAIIAEAMEKLDIDVTKYCSSERTDPITGTQMLDAVALIVPRSAIILHMDTASHSLGHDDDEVIPDWQQAYSMLRRTTIAKKDGKEYTAKLIKGAIDLSDQKAANQILVHEFGHSIGLDDLYTLSEYDNSLVCTEPMNENSGDFAGLSKLRMGWLNYDEVQYYAGGKQTFTLESSALKPNVLIIPTVRLGEWTPRPTVRTYPDDIRIPAYNFQGSLGTIWDDTSRTFNNCFLVELTTPDANMTGVVEEPGVRIMNGKWGNMYPVGKEHGFFKQGEVIDKNTDDFVQANICEQISITVDEIKDGKATVTVSGPDFLRPFPFYERLAKDGAQ